MYANIQKFIQFQLTVNVAALAINVVAAVSSGDVPLNAVQVLLSLSLPNCSTPQMVGTVIIDYELALSIPKFDVGRMKSLEIGPKYMHLSPLLA